LCAELAPGTPYWPSSAHGGSIPFQADTGTTSYYGVGAYLRPVDDARRSGLKFATECLAFANVPSPDGIERMPGGSGTRVHHPQWKARAPRDLGAGWDFEDVRDHYLQALFAVDAQKLRYADHERYLALSRQATGEVMAAAFSEWRRPASECGGALVLFLRDLWAGAGWGLLDDSGRAKACFHCVKRVLQPLAVLLTDEGGNGLFIHVINEREPEALLRLELTAWRGDVEVAQASAQIAMPGRAARTLPAQDLLGHFMDLTYAYRFGPPACEAVCVSLVNAQGEHIARAFHFPAGMPALLGIDPAITASARMLDDNTAELTVAATRVALGVHFDIPGFDAQDEHFHLAPGLPVRVRLLRRPGPAARALRGTVHALNAPAGAALRLAP
ncbi:MAG: beta-mannosidase, partial [Ramlibacter sp.]|nr:beta-mannosidase [Ramlibacter sp.]